MKIKTYDNNFIDINVKEDLSGRNIIALPGLIDPHVHFRIPGAEQKETWTTGAEAAIAGGFSTVFDMPNNSPSIIDSQTFDNKIKIIENQLKEKDIKLNYYLYLGATEDNKTEIKKLKNRIVAVKMFMGASTGDLLVDKKESQEEIFKLCAKLDIPLAVHAEDDSIINHNKEKYKNDLNNISIHSTIRSADAAIKATTEAIKMAEKYKTKLYILHVSTAEEVELISRAKAKKVNIFAETSPHHLFLNKSSYDKLGSLVQMNPPLRTERDNLALQASIATGVIDTIGSDHAPHTLEEKSTPYPNSPSGIPGIETTLPLLLNMYNENKITLERIVKLTNKNIIKIFNINIKDCWTIVDLNMIKKIENEKLKTKNKWSPFNGVELKGWPIYTVLNNKIYNLD